MATVVVKHPFVGTTGQCLVLEPREKLVYPFNFGDYQDVRWAIAISYTSATGFNTPITQDTYTPPANSPLQYPYYGFSNFNTGAFIPTQSGGYDFYGLSTNFSVPDSVGLASTTQYRWGANGIGDASLITSNITGGKKIIAATMASSLENFLTISATGITGGGLYARIFGERFITSGNNIFGLQAFSNAGATTNVSVTALRDNLNTLGSVRTAIYTGYMTSGNQDTTNNIMMKPNSLFIYNPMLNTRIRLHNIVVERYA